MFIFLFSNYCSNFKDNKQCSFCNFVSTANTYKSVIRKKETKDISEVTATAFKEGQAKHINMTGGCYISGKEIEIVGNILSEIRKTNWNGENSWPYSYSSY